MANSFVKRANEGAYEAPPRTIDEDRPCENCGYNLRGLQSSSKCPECGTPIRRRRQRATERDFCELPPSTILRFAPGFYLATAGVFGLALLLVGGWFIAWPAPLALAMLICSPAAWFIGLWLMTAPIELPGGESRGFARSSRLRIAARWLQLGWFIAAGASWMLVQGAAPGGLYEILSGAGQLAGIVGIILLAYLLANFAEWVRDDFAENCFNFTFGGLAIVSPFMLIIFPLFSTFLPAYIVLVLIAWLVWFASIIAFPLGLWSLSRSLTWAVYHSRQKIDRQQRAAAKVVAPVRTLPVEKEDFSASIPLASDHSPGATIRHDSLVQLEPQRPAEGVRRRKHAPDRGDSSGGDPTDLEVF